MSGLRIALLLSDDAQLAAGSDQDTRAVAAVQDAARAIEESCRANRWTPLRVLARANAPDATLAELVHEEVDVVFQLAETVRGEARLEAAVAWLLEWAQIPYTGSGPEAITLALDKPRARAVLASRGVPVPDGYALITPTDPLPIPPGERRWIVKPSREDASHGIEAASVVQGERALRSRAEHVIRTYRQPALVEELIEGRELNLAFLGSGNDAELGAELLPPGEIDYSRLPPGAPPILTYAAKWDEGSVEYDATPSIGARPMPRELEARVQAVARGAWSAIGLAGYGRVDLRVHAERGPFVIDVNPNPDLSSDAGFARAAHRGGISHAELVRRIVDDALRRAGAVA